MSGVERVSLRMTKVSEELRREIDAVVGPYIILKLEAVAGLADRDELVAIGPLALSRNAFRQDRGTLADRSRCV